MNIMSVFFPFPQNLEDDVTIDTVPNVKKKHEVNVGMQLFCLGVNIVINI